MSSYHTAGRPQRRCKRKASTRNRKTAARRRSCLQQRTAPQQTSMLDSSDSRLLALRSPLERLDVASLPRPDMEATPPELGRAPGWLGRQHLLRPCPLPRFSWADSEELWDFLLMKDQMYKIDPEYLARQHSILTPRMRAILLDWLIEVSEVYKLHRETFYLGVYYCDRFLAHQHDVAKEKLQLIGVTSLFVAAKMEEIYPPKLTDFAYVTDGACTEEQILSMEIIIIEALEWVLLPVTPNAWLGIFLQLANMALMKEPSENFIHPKYSGKDFIKIMQLLDLCVLDINSLQYTSSVLAASAFYLVLNDDFRWELTGQSQEMIGACVHWMLPFFTVLRQRECPKVKQFDKVARDNMHNIQTHVNGLDLLDKVDSVTCQTNVAMLPQIAPNTLTPPSSTQKL